MLHTNKTLTYFFKITFAGFLSLLFVGCGVKVPSISVQEAAELFKVDKAILIDVRENDEWLEQHIQGARFIPLSQFKKHIGSLEKHKGSTIIMQSHSGKRSYHAATSLIEAGFSKVYNLEGGILAWKEAHLETVSGP